MNIKKKIVCVLLVILTVFFTCFSLNSFAHTNITSAYLSKVGQADYHLKYNHGDRITYVICSIVGHYIDGIFYPAYCIDKNLVGAEKSPYDVSINEVLQNDAVWRVLRNGYPYKSPESMGLSEWDSFCVTKMAVYCVLGQSDIDNYLAEPEDEVAVHMLDKLRELVDIGVNGTETMKHGTLSLSKKGELTESGEFYYQEYSVSSSVKIAQYSITDITGFGDGSFVANTSGEAQNVFIAGEHFRVYIPKLEFGYDINGDISLTARCKTYPILYGESNNPNLQNYVIATDSYEDESAKVNMSIATNTGKIIINKTDDETNKPIEGVIFGLYKKDGTEVARVTTDKNGVAGFDNLYQNVYVLKEISTNEKYILNTMEFEVDVKYNETNTVNVENVHKKGNLKVYKIDKDNNEIGLGGVKFELYSEEFGKVIGNYETNQEGEIFINNLRIGNYKLHEIETNKWYNLAEDRNVVVKWNEATETIIENELKKSQVKILKVDKDNNEIKLKGIKFQVLDENKNVLETIVTDERGEAKTSKYPVRDFEKLYLHEIQTNENYSLANENIEVALEANKTKNVEIQNEKKKGTIRILKVSKGYNKLLNIEDGTPLMGAKFVIVNDAGEAVGVYETGDDGIVQIDDLVYGRYTIYEYEAPEGFLKNEQPQTIFINENEQIAEVTFQDSPLEPELPKTGMDSFEIDIISLVVLIFTGIINFIKKYR